MKKNGRTLTPDVVWQLRTKMGMTARELAELLGVSASAVTNWEGGRWDRGKDVLYMKEEHREKLRKLAEERGLL